MNYFVQRVIILQSKFTKNLCYIFFYLYFVQILVVQVINDDRRIDRINHPVSSRLERC